MANQGLLLVVGVLKYRNILVEMDRFVELILREAPFFRQFAQLRDENRRCSVLVEGRLDNVVPNRGLEVRVVALQVRVDARVLFLRSVASSIGAPGDRDGDENTVCCSTLVSGASCPSPTRNENLIMHEPYHAVSQQDETPYTAKVCPFINHTFLRRSQEPDSCDRRRNVWLICTTHAD